MRSHGEEYFSNRFRSLQVERTESKNTFSLPHILQFENTNKQKKKFLYIALGPIPEPTL